MTVVTVFSREGRVKRAHVLSLTQVLFSIGRAWQLGVMGVACNAYGESERDAWLSFAFLFGWALRRLPTECFAIIIYFLSQVTIEKAYFIVDKLSRK